MTFLNDKDTRYFYRWIVEQIWAIHINRIQPHSTAFNRNSTAIQPQFNRNSTKINDI